MIYNKNLFAFLFIASIIFCKSKDKNLILEMGGEKEFIAINENLVVCFDEESNVCVFGELIGISEGKISLKKEINNDIIEIPINKVTKITISTKDALNRVTKSLFTGCCLGFIAPIGLMLNGHMKTPYGIITPILLTPLSSIIGGRISAKIGRRVLQKEYIINDKKWIIINI